MPKSPEPLPLNPFLDKGYQVAYEQCLALEARAGELPETRGRLSPLVCARLLGHFLRLAPPGKGQEQLRREINEAVGDLELMDLAVWYSIHFIRAFKQGGGGRRSPIASDHPSCPPSEDAREYAELFMHEGRLDHSTVRRLAFFRDNDTCLVTGIRGEHAEGSITVQVAHIIPASTCGKIELWSDKRRCITSVWAILAMFGRESLVEEFSGNQIDRLENIMTLNLLSHHRFGQLKLWLKPVDNEPHTYKVCAPEERLKIHPPLPEFVTFSTTTNLPLPDPELLGLHALCCEVAWMSGAAEHIEDVDRRMEDLKVLADDGSNVDLLMTALSLVEASDLTHRIK